MIRAFLATFIALAIFTPVIYMAIADYRRRRLMTPEQRREEDERLEMWTW